MLTFIFTEFFELYFRRSFRYTNARAVVSVAALATFKPDILPFALLFSHKVHPQQTGTLN